MPNSSGSSAAPAVNTASSSGIAGRSYGQGSAAAAGPGSGSGSGTSVQVGFGSSGTGGFGGIGASVGPAAASNLNALKMSVNSFTRELASSMNISRGNTGDGGVGGGSGSPQGAGSGSGSSRDGKATLFGKPGGFGNFNMQQTAARTREGLARLANLGKLGGKGEGDS